MATTASVTLGVDTHKDLHIAVTLDQLGRRLGIATFGTDDTHLRTLWAWASDFGPITQAGVEGTGSFGYRLAQFLTSADVPVFEVNRPNRVTRRRRGKSDPADAEAAARAVLAGDATATPRPAPARPGSSAPCWSPAAAPSRPAPKPSSSCAASSWNSPTTSVPNSTTGASSTSPARARP